MFFFNIFPVFYTAPSVPKLRKDCKYYRNRTTDINILIILFYKFNYFIHRKHRNTHKCTNVCIVGVSGARRELQNRFKKKAVFRPNWTNAHGTKNGISHHLCTVNKSYLSTLPRDIFFTQQQFFGYSIFGDLLSFKYFLIK